MNTDNGTKRELECFVETVLRNATKMLCASHGGMFAALSYKPEVGFELSCGCVRPSAVGQPEPPRDLILLNRSPWTSKPIQ